MATDIVAIARTWIGTPYLHQASLKGVGCDCLGLIRGVLREVVGHELEEVPAYAADWGLSDGIESLRDAARRHLSECASEVVRPGQIVLFRMHAGAAARHCGVVGMGDRDLTLIHARQNKRVCEEPFGPFWRRRTAHLFCMKD